MTSFNFSSPGLNLSEVMPGAFLPFGMYSMPYFDIWDVSEYAALGEETKVTKLGWLMPRLQVSICVQ